MPRISSGSGASHTSGATHTSDVSHTSGTHSAKGSSKHHNPIDMWNSSGSGAMTNGMTADLKSAASDPSNSSGPPQDAIDLNKAMMHKRS